MFYPFYPFYPWIPSKLTKLPWDVFQTPSWSSCFSLSVPILAWRASEMCTKGFRNPTESPVFCQNGQNANKTPFILPRSAKCWWHLFLTGLRTTRCSRSCSSFSAGGLSSFQSGFGVKQVPSPHQMSWWTNNNIDWVTSQSFTLERRRGLDSYSILSIHLNIGALTDSRIHSCNFWNLVLKITMTVGVHGSLMTIVGLFADAAFQTEDLLGTELVCGTICYPLGTLKRLSSCSEWVWQFCCWISQMKLLLFWNQFWLGQLISRTCRRYRCHPLSLVQKNGAARKSGGQRMGIVWSSNLQIGSDSKRNRRVAAPKPPRFNTLELTLRPT